MKLFRIGSVFAARYEIRALLGVGPFGATYCAADRDSGGEVALKVLHANLFPTASERRSFEAALRRMGSITHPALRRFYDVDVSGPLVFYTGAYYAAESLRQVLLRGMRYEPYELEPLFWQITRALESLGASSHGGLRPENILLLSGGVKLTEVGFAPALPFGVYASTLMKEGFGPYIAPEAKEGNLSHRADVYSLGIIFSELLLGAPPKGDLPASLTHRLGPALVEVLQKALSRDAFHRYKSATAFFEGISSAIYAERPKEPKQNPENLPEISDAEILEVEPLPQRSNIPEISRIETIIPEPPEDKGRKEENEPTVIRLLGPFEEVSPSASTLPDEPSKDLFDQPTHEDSPDKLSHK